MTPISSYSTVGQVSRRRLLRGAVVTVGGLAGAAMVGCSTSTPKPAGTAAPGAAGTAAPVAKTYPKGSLVPVVNAKIKDGGTFTEAAASGSVEFDAHTTLTASQWRNSGELAIMPDPWTTDLVGKVVESWETPDPTTIILKVRDNVAIHNKPPWNGRLFDAEDLAFNLNRIQGNTADAEGVPKSGFQRASTLEGMKSVEVVDKSHVKVNLSKAVGQWLNGLCEHRNFMMPKGVVEVGFKDPTKLAGTSAYEMTSFDKSTEVYTRWDKYWGGKPHFDQYKRIIIPDQAALAAAFISKQTSFLNAPTPPQTLTIKAARPDALFYQTPGYLHVHIRPNMKVAALNDFRVRKAIQLTLNYPEILTAVGEGTYAMAVSSNYPEGWTSDKVLSLPGYNVATKDKDIADAVKLMTAAGHEGGKDVAYEITVTATDTAKKEDSLRMQSQVQKVFPQAKITLKPVDSAAFSKLQSGRDFQAIAYNIGVAPAISPEAYAEFHTKGARNYGSFTNPESDAMLEKGLAALKVEERKQIYETWQQKFLDEWMPWWGLHIPAVQVFVQPNIVNFDTTVGPWSEWWVYQAVNKLGLADA